MSFALFHVAWWDNRVYPLPGKLKTLFKTVIHFVVGVYGNFDALGIQIPIYTSNSVYNLHATVKINGSHSRLTSALVIETPVCGLSSANFSK